jgi:4-hydroxy-2-oxoheptanedioate aldolase
MRINHVKQRLAQAMPTTGCFLGLGSPNVTELLAHAGFDWLVIETEHNALGPEKIELMLMAIDGTNAIPIVRPPSSNQLSIQNALDIGAMGLMVPMIKSVEEAASVVSATRYPPDGTRGFGPVRASRYNFDREDYFKRANDNILVVLIIETKEAWENLEAIARVPGIDVLFLGLSDLSLSLGLDLLNPPKSKIAAIEKRALIIGKKHGVAIGTGANSAEQLRLKRKQGFRFIGCTDYVMLANAALNYLTMQPSGSGLKIGRAPGC